MRTVLLGTAAAIAAATIAVAQPASPPQRPERGAWMQAHEAEMAQMRQHRADDIALLIGLRPDQRPAFDAMLKAMEPPHPGWGRDGHGPNGGPDGAMPGAMQEESLGARLDRMAAKIDERGAAEKAKLAQLKSFYASLSPDQRLRFDALDRLRRDHMGHMGHMGGHRGGPDGPMGERGPGMMPPPMG